MSSQGCVRVWHDEEGWGIIDSDSTPGGCWVHYSAILAVGFRSLEVGQAVTFTAEAVEQDGYAHRALEVWPSDAEPVRMASDPSTPSAYWSTLTLAFDDDQ